MATDHEACNCCGLKDWEYSFTERGVDLGRCRNCGLYYVSPMPGATDRHAEVADGRFADNQIVGDAKTHLEGERNRAKEFGRYIEILLEFAPSGRWLEVGCGTGVFIEEAQRVGINIEGIELTRDRRSLAEQNTGAMIYGNPLEDLDLLDSSYSAITLIYVFSHLTDPMSTFREAYRILKPGGVLLLRTGEMGPGVKKHHSHDWNLGDHLYFLGDDTINIYCEKLGFDLIHRESVWEPDTKYSKEFFRTPGRSRIRNAVKFGVATVPGALSALRTLITRTFHSDNPAYSSTLVLRKA